MILQKTLHIFSKSKFFCTILRKIWIENVELHLKIMGSNVCNMINVKNS